MSVDYYFANHSKKQYFAMGLYGECSRRRSAGFGLGSRALCLLISDRGSWRGDDLEMVDNVTDEFTALSTEYVDISIEAELMILDVDGVEYFSGDHGSNVARFVSLCAYGLALRRPDVLEHLDKEYGRDKWTSECKSEFDSWMQQQTLSVYAAQERNLCIYRL